MKKIFFVLLFVFLVGAIVFAEDNSGVGGEQPVPTLYDNNLQPEVNDGGPVVEPVLISAGPNELSDGNGLFSNQSEELQRLRNQRDDLRRQLGDLNFGQRVRDVNFNERMSGIIQQIAQKEDDVNQLQINLINNINDLNLSPEKKQLLIDSITQRFENRIADLNESASERISNVMKKMDRMSTMDEVRTYRDSLRDSFVEAARDNNLVLKEEVRAARVVIAQIISEAIKNNPDINFSDINGLGEEIQIEIGRIIADANNIIQAKRIIHTTIRNHALQIRSDSNSVEISDENQLVLVDGNILVNDDGVKVDGKKISILPSDIKKRFKQIERMDLRVENGVANYAATVNNIRNLFGFIRMDVNEVVHIDAENGVVTSYDVPWWGVLSTGTDLVTANSVIVS